MRLRRRRRLDRPDRLVFDLDPDAELRWSEVVAAALLLRARLSDLGLDSFVQTTGGNGLHVVLPIDRRSTWDEARSFTHAIASEFRGGLARPLHRHDDEEPAEGPHLRRPFSQRVQRDVHRRVLDACQDPTTQRSVVVQSVPLPSGPAD